MPWGGSPRQHTYMESNNDDFFGEQAEEPASSVAAELDQEWRARETRHRTHGYREGLTAGKNDAVQSGFEQGVRDTVTTSFRWGQARGVASAFAALPPPLQQKLIPNNNVCKLIQQTDSLFQPLSTLDAARAYATSLNSHTSIDALPGPAEAGASHTPASLPDKNQSHEQNPSQSENQNQLRREWVESPSEPPAASRADVMNQNVLPGSGGDVSDRSSYSLSGTEVRGGVAKDMPALGAAGGHVDQQIADTQSCVHYAAISKLSLVDRGEEEPRPHLLSDPSGCESGGSGACACRGKTEECAGGKGGGCACQEEGGEGGDVAQKFEEEEDRGVREALMMGDDLLDEGNARQVLVGIEHIQIDLWRSVSPYGVVTRLEPGGNPNS